MRKESEPKETRYEHLRVIDASSCRFHRVPRGRYYSLRRVSLDIDDYWIGLDFFSISIYQSIFLLLIFHINSN